MFLVLKLITFQTFHWFNYSIIRSSDKYAWFCWLLTKDLIKKKLATNSLSDKWTKSLYWDYYLHHNVNFCGTVLKSPPWQKKTFLTTPNVENQFWSSYETRDLLILKFYPWLHIFSELWHLFSQVSIKDCLVPLCVISGTFFISLVFEKC